MVLDDDVVIARRADVLWRGAPGYLVVATLDDEVIEAAGPAPEIWRAIDPPTSVGDLIAGLAEAHALTPEQIRQDVTSFLSELIDAGLIDAGPTDTGLGHTGPTATGPTDAGPTDAGLIDAGPTATGRERTGFDETGSVEADG